MSYPIIKLSDQVKIPVQQYASQGNAILGIRDSGKTYSATFLDEQLMEAGVPTIAIDPIGVWRYLKVPGKGKGFEVVVAGGAAGDLPLTPASAPEIVRAAMHENINLELCDCLFLHRQKGRNSLTALGKWLDFADAAASKEIVRSLPTLGQGECWVWEQGSDSPKRVKMPAKQTELVCR